MFGFLDKIFQAIFRYNDWMNAVGSKHTGMIREMLKHKLGESAYSMVLVLILAVLFGLLVVLWLVLNHIVKKMLEKEPRESGPVFLPDSKLFLGGCLAIVAFVEISWLLRWTPRALEVVVIVLLAWRIIQVARGALRGQLPRQLLGLTTVIVLILVFPYLWSAISLMIIGVIIAATVLGGVLGGGSSGTAAEETEPYTAGSVHWPGIMYQGLTEFQYYGDVGYGKQYKNMSTGEIVVVTNFVPAGPGEANTSIGHVTWPG